MSIGFLIKSGTDPVRDAMGGLIASQRRSIRLSVKYVDILERKFSGSLSELL